MTPKRPLPDSRARDEERRAQRLTRALIGVGIAVVVAVALLLILGLA